MKAGCQFNFLIRLQGEKEILFQANSMEVPHLLQDFSLCAQMKLLVVIGLGVGRRTLGLKLAGRLAEAARS